MKYVIRKVPERDTTYLERLIPGALIYSDVEHVGPIKSFALAMEMVNDDAVYVQDDMILCENFYERCNEICEAHMNEVVQFSNFTYDSNRTRVLTEGYYTSYEVPWCTCIYIPKRISSLYVSRFYAGSLYMNKNDLKEQADDWVLAHLIKYIGEDVYLVVPNLAGHSMDKSTVLSERDSQIRLCMNFEYDKAVPRGDMSRELKYYRRDYEKFRKLRAEQERGKLK